MKTAIAMMIECFMIPRKHENDFSSSQFGCVEVQQWLLRHRSTDPTSGGQNASVTSSTLTKKTHTYRHCLRHSLEEDTVAPHEVRNCTIGSTLGLQRRIPGADEVLTRCLTPYFITHWQVSQSRCKRCVDIQPRCSTLLHVGIWLPTRQQR
jgi:hypothetical protein